MVIPHFSHISDYLSCACTSKLDAFTDVRELQHRLKAQRIELIVESDKDISGPASFMAMDPDGNPILVDQHVWRTQTPPNTTCSRRCSASSRNDLETDR